MNKFLEQLREEQEKDIAKLEQYQHRLQRLNNRIKYYEDGERKKRVHRLITRGAAVESIIPEIKGMEEVPFYTLMEQILTMPEVDAVIQAALSRELQ